MHKEKENIDHKTIVSIHHQKTTEHIFQKIQKQKSQTNLYTSSAETILQTSNISILLTCTKSFGEDPRRLYRKTRKPFY